MIELCKNQQLEKALSLFFSRPDAGGATALIGLCSRSSADLDTAFKIYDTLKESAAPNAHVFTALLSACHKNAQFEKVLHLFDEMMTHDISVNHVCFGIVAGACASQRDARTARKLLRIWQEGLEAMKGTAARGIKLMQALLVERDLPSILEVFRLTEQDCKKTKEPLPAPIFTTLIDACIKCDQPERALPLRLKMQENSIDVLRNEALFKCLLRISAATGEEHAVEFLYQGLLRNKLTFALNEKDCTQMLMALIKADRLAEALDTFDWMSNSELPVRTEQSFIVLLTGCAEAASVHQGQLLFERLNTWKKEEMARRAFFEPQKADELTSATISMCAKCAQQDRAELLFEEAKMVANSATRGLGVSVWNAMINAYAIHGDAKSASALFEEVQKSANPTPPNRVTLICLLNAFSHAGEVENSLALLHRMEKDYGIPPDVHHYTCVVDALGRAGRLAEAEEMILNGQVEPNFVTWQTFLGACRWHGDVDRVMRHFPEAMRRATNKDDKASLFMLKSNILGAAGRFGEQTVVNKEMEDLGLRRRMGKTWIEIDGVTHSFIAHDATHPRSSDIYKELATLEQEMREVGFTPDTRYVTHDVSEERKEQLLCHHSEKLALALGLLATPPGTPLLLRKNLRVCPNCHAATALISKLRKRSITVRDANRFHHFEDGKCSCKNYW